jgi:hypothetical protein
LPIRRRDSIDPSGMQSSTASTPPLAAATPFAVFRDGRNPGWLEGHSFRHGEEVVNTNI